MNEKSELGVLIDCSIEDFEEAVSSYSVGVIKSLILTLNSVYQELSGRHEAVLASPTITLGDKETAVKGLFAEMLKIEEKVTYLEKRSKDLIPQVFDTDKH